MNSTLNNIVKREMKRTETESWKPTTTVYYVLSIKRKGRWYHHKEVSTIDDQPTEYSITEQEALASGATRVWKHTETSERIS